MQPPWSAGNIFTNEFVSIKVQQADFQKSKIHSWPAYFKISHKSEWELLHAFKLNVILQV